MPQQLLDILTMSPDRLERALREATEEARDVRHQLRELESFTAAARQLLDREGPWYPWPPLRGPQRPMTLHAAMEVVLTDSRTGWLDTRSIAMAIARRAPYRRRDGRPPTVNDVSARVSTYPSWFKREGPMIRLRTDPQGHRHLPLAPPPPQATPSRRRRPSRRAPLAWNW